MKTFKIVGDDISDGYHTFTELYEHRCLLFLNLALRDPESCAWKEDYEGWFCLYWQSGAGQVSYHLPIKYLPLVKLKIKAVTQPIYDGHDSREVAKRLDALAFSLGGSHD